MIGGIDARAFRRAIETLYRTSQLAHLEAMKWRKLAYYYGSKKMRIFSRNGLRSGTWLAGEFAEGGGIADYLEGGPVGGAASAWYRTDSEHGIAQGIILACPGA